MRYLNLGCGAVRPQLREWVNLDNIESRFTDPNCAERKNLAKEPNYVECDITKGFRGVFEDNIFYGIMASHILEHFDLQTSFFVMEECYRILRNGGVMRIVQPCPAKILEGERSGKKDWGVVFPHEGEFSFLKWVMFFHEHKQIIGREALECLCYEVGFLEYGEKEYKESNVRELVELDNRPEFSFFYEAVK